MRGTKLTINLRRVTRALLLIVAVLTLASVAGQVARYVFGRYPGFGLIPAFDLNLEHNIPTWFSSVMLFLCALLLGLIALATMHARERYAAHWSLLSIVLVYFSLDEIISIHEGWNLPFRGWFHTTAALHPAWVIPGALFVLIMVYLYAGFISALPRNTRRRFVLSAVLYFGGAIGMELVGGQHAFYTGKENLVYALITTVEETLEMLGIVVFIHTLLHYLTHQGLTLQVGRGR